MTSQDEILTSQELRAEFDEVVQRKNLSRRIEELPVFGAFKRQVRVVEAVVDFDPTCRDADDDHVLACAVAATADVILTGDLDLLTLDPFRGIRIFTPRQFLVHFYPHHLVP